MTTRRDFIKVLGAALGVAVVPAALAQAADLCRTDADVADLIDKALGRREAYAVQSTMHIIGFDPAVPGYEHAWFVAWAPSPILEDLPWKEGGIVNVKTTMPAVQWRLVSP